MSGLGSDLEVLIRVFKVWIRIRIRVGSSDQGI
jgi:hypothetical protein